MKPEIVLLTIACAFAAAFVLAIAGLLLDRVFVALRKFFTNTQPAGSPASLET